MAPESAWVIVERAFVLRSPDRFREAETVVDRALSIRPQSGAAWHWTGRFVAVRDVDSSNLACELVNLEIDCGELEAAASALDRAAELMPSAEKLGREWAAWVRGEVGIRPAFREGTASAGAEPLARLSCVTANDGQGFGIARG